MCTFYGNWVEQVEETISKPHITFKRLVTTKGCSLAIKNIRDSDKRVALPICEGYDTLQGLEHFLACYKEIQEAIDE